MYEGKVVSEGQVVEKRQTGGNPICVAHGMKVGPGNLTRPALDPTELDWNHQSCQATLHGVWWCASTFYLPLRSRA